MALEDTVLDAEALHRDGRHTSALTLMLTAVAASAVRAFPSAKTDGEKFKGFIGGRLRRLLTGGFEDSIGTSGVVVHTTDHKGVERPMDMSEVLYHLYRCPLVHESELPANAEFVPGTSEEALELSVERDRIRVAHGIIPLLARVVREADCNADLYGRKLVTLRPRQPFDEAAFRADLLDVLKAKRNASAVSVVTPGRYEIMRSALRLLWPTTVDSLDDNQLKDAFRALCSTGALNGGEITGLESAGLCDRGGTPSALGIEMLRALAEKLEVVACTFVPR